MADRRDSQEEGLKSRYNVRQVTNIQASWTERGRGEEGRFTLQLILDNGVEEYILEPEAEDIDYTSSDPRFSTLAWSARVCKAFSEPALKVLWRTLPDIFPLLKLISKFQDIRFVEGRFINWSSFVSVHCTSPVTV